VSLGITAAEWPSPFEFETTRAAAKDYLERQKLTAELDKLRGEARIASHAWWLEPIKAILPTIGIAGSILVASWNIKHDQAKTREAGFAAASRTFQTEMAREDGTPDEQVARQKNAFTTFGMAARDGGARAVPFIIASVENTNVGAIDALYRATLELDGDPDLRPVITAHLLAAIQDVTASHLNDDKPYVPVPTFRSLVGL